MQRAKLGSNIIIPAHDTRVPVHLPEEWFDLPPESRPEPELIAAK